MLRIGIDYRPAILLRSGIGRYVANLARWLPEVDEDVTVSLFSVFWEKHRDRMAAAKVPRGDRIELAAARFPGRVLEFLGRFTPLSVETWTEDLDLFHFTDYVYPPVKTETAVCTIFDTSYLRPEPFHTKKNTARLIAVAQTLVDRARVVITISETTKADIIEHYGVDADRIVVAPLGVDETFLAETPRTEQEVPYVLSLGTLEPRKNLARTLDAFERILEEGVEARMVIVGRKGWMCDDVFERLERPRLAEAVTWLGEVTDTALSALLANASVLVYPSLWEGFGLPVVEGMAAGLPVLTSRRGALEEVAGDGAHLVDPESLDEIADGLRQLLTDSEYRTQVAERGRERARQFTWAECARKTVEAYRLALG